jgi:hypothetical protein
MNILKRSKVILWASLAGLVVVTGASAAGTFNNAETGYTICVDKKTKAVTFPGTEKCKSGQSKLIIGAQGLKGDTGATGPAGLEGPAGVPGLNGTNGVNGADGANGANGADGVNGANGAEGATGPSGPSVMWISPVDLVHPALAANFPNVSLASVTTPTTGGGEYKQFVAKIAENNFYWNIVQATVAIPESWRKSGNVYATVYWAAEKTDGNIKMQIGYAGLQIGKVPLSAGYQEFCANSIPTTANVIQTCTKKISDLIYADDEMSYVSLNRYGAQSAGLENPDTNTGALYIYGIKLELRN